MTKKKHRRIEIGGNWILICPDDMMVTRADYSFSFCPSCGEEL